MKISHKINIVAFVLAFSILIIGCASAKSKFEHARNIDTIDSYLDFLIEHPNSEYRSQAKRRLAVKYGSTHKQQNEDKLFELLKYERAYKRASADGSIAKLKAFLKEYSHGTHTIKARIQLAKAAFAKAAAAGKDDALIAFIKNYEDSNLIDAAIKKLRNYELYKGDYLIPWSQLPTVDTGRSRDAYYIYCGINIEAFSSAPEVKWSMVRLLNMKSEVTGYLCGNASLTLRQWTTFDGFIAKGFAVIEKNGLMFKEQSMVLRSTR